MVFKSSLDYVATSTTLVSFITTLICCHVVSPMLSNMFVSAYKSVKHRDHWNTLFGSTVHAMVSLLLMLIVVGGGFIENYVVSKSSLGFFTLQISLGYFLGDFFLVIASPSLRKDIGLLAHHLTSMSGIFLSLLYEGHLMYFPIFRLIGEASTPFVNLRWLLQETSVPKTSKWSLVAAVGMTVTFFISRIVPIPWQWYVTITTVTDQACYVIPLHYRVVLCVSMLVFDILNVYWMYKIFRGALKFIRTVKSRKNTQ